LNINGDCCDHQMQHEHCHDTERQHASEEIDLGTDDLTTRLTADFTTQGPTAVRLAHPQHWYFSSISLRSQKASPPSAELHSGARSSAYNSGFTGMVTNAIIDTITASRASAYAGHLLPRHPDTGTRTAP
jgi:hypothetical protein